MLFTHRPFLFYLGARSCSRFATQVAAVAVGWQIYELTGSAFQLGMIGLVQFIPSALMVFIAGHVADRYDRRRVIALSQIAEAITAGYLAFGTYGGWITVPGIFVAMVVLGLATGFESPAVAALLPGVVPEGEVQRGTAVSTGAAQIRHDHRTGNRRLCLRRGAEPALRADGRSLAAGGAVRACHRARAGARQPYLDVVEGVVRRRCFRAA